MESAIIRDVRVAAAHEGIAELVVSIEYENGGTAEVALDQMATSALMDSCNASSIEDVKGQSWDKVRDALQVSYNRYQ
ncbi:MAG: hypothetical protein HOB98_05810 [Gammaproteobacteria bacterium]|jgi:hypothetical protein|nr:hypothetical protein [Gammaproteobacteria bacterium]HAT25494.1 hypothetical protein [Gammaproteobacteria bacterium]HIE89373.1 hypothetical protein [Gammaproteobacteria bacterium]|tara:strand:- start:736 stop:969 length:234 start_codon:yes stop_codon:yes gene_type:complete